MTIDRCTEEKPCSRPDSDGWYYEYWADEDGEHKGKRLHRTLDAERKDKREAALGLAGLIALRERGVKVDDDEMSSALDRLLDATR